MKNLSTIEIIDISRTISSESLVYPGDDPLQMNSICTIDDSCPCNITKLGWSTHFLTHVDPPRHFIKEGKTLNDLPLDRFLRTARVIEIYDDSINSEHFPDENLEGVCLLFKTRNSKEFSNSEFNTSHVYVSKDAALKAVEMKINMLGIDYISVDKFGDDKYPAHSILLGNDVLILEGIDLSAVEPGNYILSALPLKIDNGDGSPVRAILIRS